MWLKNSGDNGWMWIVHKSMNEKYVKMACYVEGKDDDQTAKQIDEEWVVG